MDEQLLSALRTCAAGAVSSEVVEEFTVENGELKLVKKKVTRRDSPPDLKAVKMLLEESCGTLSDEQLDAEIEKIKKILKEDDIESD